MRFLHTGDWHLGRIFQGVHLTDDQAFVLEQLVQMVREYQPDAVVVAGDVYDRAVPPSEAVALLDDVLSKIIVDLDCPVLMIAGNHDSPNRVDFGGRLLSQRNFHVVGKLRAPIEPVVLMDEFGPVHFALLPFAEPQVVRDVYRGELAQKGAPEMTHHRDVMTFLVKHAHAAMPAEGRKVLVAHGSVAGGAESESERPLWAGSGGWVSPDLFSGFDYTALGHFHTPQALTSRVRYAGSLMKYSFSEVEQDKSISLVDIDAEGEVKVEQLALRPRHDVRKVEGPLAELLAQGRHASEDYIYALVTDDKPSADPLGRLREVFPNIVHVAHQKPDLSDEIAMAPGDFAAMGDAALFRRFYESVTDGQMSLRQMEIVSEILQDLDLDAREAE